MSHYPAVSHAFVLREVEAVRELGVDVETFSIHRTDGSALLAAADRDAAATTFSVLPVRLAALLRSHSAAFARSPHSYLATLLLALRTSPPGFRERLWRLFYFAEAMVVQRRCRLMGVSHLHAHFADSATDVAMLVSGYECSARADPRALTWSLAVHGPVEFDDVTRFALARKLERAAFAVAISDFGRSQLMRLTSEDRWEHIHVVRCGVHPEIYVPPANRAHGTGAITILFVGRLIAMKGPSLLLDSAAALVAEGHDVRVVLIGDGPARAELEQRITSLGLAGRAQLRGAVGQDQIRAIYAAADIFCLPSFAEGIPVVAMEAMAMEIPVVTTRIMGIPELIENNVDGMLVTPGRMDELTDALRTLVLSAELREALGAAGRRRIRTAFDVRESARRLQEVLEAELG